MLRRKKRRCNGQVGTVGFVGTGRGIGCCVVSGRTMMEGKVVEGDYKKLVSKWYSRHETKRRQLVGLGI